MRRSAAEKMKEVVAIRELQRLKAESDAAKASADLRGKQSMLEADEREADALEAAWLSSISSPSVEIALARLWSSALLRQAAKVESGNRSVDAAQEALDVRARELHAATSRTENSKELARKAEKAFAERRDDGRIAECLDQFPFRRGVS